MLLSLVATSLALTVPVTAKISDELHNGGTEGFRQTVTGSVAVTNPATGAVYRVGTEELTVNKRGGSGEGALDFAGDPAGTLRRWALYYLDANGRVLGDPEVVEMLFDANGDGALVGRDLGTVTSLRVRATSGVDHAGHVEVQDGGVDAALVGIVELTHEGPALRTDADMALLDAGTYAAFQELGLDAVLAIDSRTVTLQGDITVSGLSVASDGTVEEGADLRWDITLYDPTTYSCPLRVCDAPTPTAIATVSYLEQVGAVKRRSGQPPAVKLQPADATEDGWATTVEVVLPGEHRDLELMASLDFEGAGGSDAVSLDPGTIGVTWETASCPDGYDECPDDEGGWPCCAPPIVDIFIDTDCDDCGDYDYVDPTNPPGWVSLADELFEVEVLDSAGGFVASHFCTLSPTAATIAGTKENPTLVGECTGGTAGTEVRRLRATMIPSDRGDYDVVKFDLEMGGAAFMAESRLGECARLDGCSTETTTVLGGTIGLWNDGVLVRQPGSITVTEAEFQLPFSFADDVAGLTGALTIEFADPVYDLTWLTTDEAHLGYYGDRLMRTIAFADLDVVTNRNELRCEASTGKTGNTRTGFCTSWGD